MHRRALNRSLAGTGGLLAVPTSLLKQGLRRLVGERLWGEASVVREATRKLLCQLIGREPVFKVQVRCQCKDFKYYISTEGLGPETVVYSFGVGTDIGFEISLIRMYGVQVHAFDPSPAAVAWIRTQRLPEEFHFHELGVGTHDGMAEFFSPLDAANPNWSMVTRAAEAGAVVQCPIRRLCSIARMLGHSRIDILKLDIEGAEYGVIADWLKEGPEVHQLLVEFHHRKPQVGNQKTRDAVALLNSNGYKIFYVSSTGPELSFLKV